MMGDGDGGGGGGDGEGGDGGNANPRHKWQTGTAIGVQLVHWRRWSCSHWRRTKQFLQSPILTNN